MDEVVGGDVLEGAPLEEVVQQGGAGDLGHDLDRGEKNRICFRWSLGRDVSRVGLAFSSEKEKPYYLCIKESIGTLFSPRLASSISSKVSFLLLQAGGSLCLLILSG